MGRELRKVIQNWDHPKKSNGGYQPMFDSSYIERLNEWIAENNLWEKGIHPDQLDGSGNECGYYADWAGNAPDVEYYRPDWSQEDMTWFQVYETVSEGTPVTPPFETKEELVNYLVENGDFWDQKRRKEGNSFMNCDPWTREQAEAFLESERVPSGVITNGKYMTGVEALVEDK